MEIAIEWRLTAEEVDDLPAGFVLPRAFPHLALVPQQDDLVSFAGLPGVTFMVQFREFAFGGRLTSPSATIRVHLKRLSLP